MPHEATPMSWAFEPSPESESESESGAMLLLMLYGVGVRISGWSELTFFVCLPQELQSAKGQVWRGETAMQQLRASRRRLRLQDPVVVGRAAAEEETTGEWRERTRSK